MGQVGGDVHFTLAEECVAILEFEFEFEFELSQSVVLIQEDYCM